jgi:hypothetical protein
LFAHKQYAGHGAVDVHDSPLVVVIYYATNVEFCPHDIQNPPYMIVPEHAITFVAATYETLYGAST